MVICLLSIIQWQAYGLGATATKTPALKNTASESVTYNNLYASVQGETNAHAKYTAFAAKADEEGYAVIARLFRATAEAEAKHAADEWAILLGMGATDHPTADSVAVGTTAENLQAAYDGETYEWTEMYPGFKQAADSEGIAAASRIFNYAMQAEQVHANNYKDVLTKLAAGDTAAIDSTYATVYRCPVCGEVVTSLPTNCPICRTSGTRFVTYNGTYFNLLAAVQGETNANAKYTAFAEKAKEEGYNVIAQLFRATADAEANHANDEWAVLKSMNITQDRPAAETPEVGTTAENLQAAYDGETYEWTEMYPGFKAVADSEKISAASKIFNYAMKAEHVHANNYNDVLTKLTDGDTAVIDSAYAVVYRCPVCGEVVTTLPNRCPICGTVGSRFVMYSVAPVIIASLSDGEVGVEYNDSLMALGDTPITWAIVSGGLPTGLSLDSISGAISGIPTQAGEFFFTVTATNSTGTSCSAMFSIMIAPTTAITDAQQAVALNAYVSGGMLHIGGLTVGNVWSIYSVAGALVNQNTARSDQVNISLPARGVYIIKSGNKSVKVVY